MPENLLGDLLSTQSAYLFDRDEFAVHCPMVLTALARMGATDQQLQTYFNNWKNDNPMLNSGRNSAAEHNIMTIDMWQFSLNQTGHFERLQQFFSTMDKADIVPGCHAECVKSNSQSTGQRGLSCFNKTGLWTGG